MMNGIRPTLLATVMLAMTLASASPSRADLIATTIFDNTGAVGSPNEQNLDLTAAWAQGFKTTSAVSLHQVSLWLRNFTGTPEFAVNLYGASGSAGSLVPGTFIKELYKGSIANSTFDDLLITAPVATPLYSLAADTSYFIAVELTGLNTGSLRWQTSSTSAPETAARQSSSGWTAQSSAVPQLMMKLEQFEEVAAVPEPGAVLFASAVCGGGLLVKRWRRRKA